MGYSREIYEEAEAKLERRRLYSEQELQKRRDLLYMRSPKAEELVHQLAHTSVATAKAIFSGSDTAAALAKLRETNLAYQQELKKIIAGFGFPENYLEEWHQCPDCCDRGYIDGRMCRCMKTLLRETAYERLNKISPLSLSDFDTFSLDYYSKTPPNAKESSPYETMSKVLAFCRKYALHFSLNSRSLLFQGGPGLGKTHLSLAIAKHAIDNGYGVIYVSAPAIMSKIESERFGGRGRSEDTEQLVLDCDLLIIDDLGTEFTTKFTVSAIYNIINSRTIMSKPTIISTNLTLAELQEKYNFRTVSRIIGTLDRLHFVGSDIRQLKRKR
ncbi:MAG: ATP-binding protein [Clostridia bacterium]|nr:ATP-binding protein [Clostridia bacterium]